MLLIACANVASLLLARGAERQREMAVRLAIGASRARVVRELLIESGVLALAAVPAALAVSWLSLKLIVAYMPAKIARFVAGWYQMDIDLRLIAFTSALAIVTAFVFGLIPAIQASRPRLAETLKEGGRSSTTGAARLRLRRGLVVAEMALALPLLVAAALSVLTVHRFLNGPQGFNPEGVLTMQLSLPEARYPTADTRSRFAAAVVDRLRAVSGVDAAAAINIMPAAGSNSGRSIEIEVVPIPIRPTRPRWTIATATPELFAALQIPIRSGRGFTDGDREDTQPVAIVTESLARRYWPNADPIGKRIKLGTGPWLTVVGVSGNHIHDWFERRNYPTIYRPFRQAPTGGNWRSSSGRRATRRRSPAEARAAVRAVDPSQPVFELQPMRKALRGAHDRTAVRRRDHAGLRRPRAAARGNRRLRRHGAHGHAADARDRRAHGARRHASRCPPAHRRANRTADRRRRRRRHRAVAPPRPSDRSRPSRRRVERRADHRRSCRDPGGVVTRRGLLPARRAASIDPTVALRGE